MTMTMIRHDSQIKTDVLNELKWDHTVNETEIGVQVRDGIATLSGHVGAHAKKVAAVAAAHRVFGVLDVVDDMKVRIPSVWERTDQDIASAVRNALIWDVFVPDRKIKSTVTSGAVTLEGAVDNWIERHNAEKAVHRLAGVRDVINKITVAAKAVDASQIKRDIESALERRTEREAKRLSVGVHDGTVTLTGTLRSWGEKNAAEHVAWATPGVRHVNDQTVVDPNI